MHNAIFNSNSLGHHNGNTVNVQFITSDLDHEVTNAITLQVIDVNKICMFTYVTQPKWAPQPRGPLCFAHAAQSIATPLSTTGLRIGSVK